MLKLLDKGEDKDTGPEGARLQRWAGAQAGYLRGPLSSVVKERRTTGSVSYRGVRPSCLEHHLLLRYTRDAKST